MSGGPVGALGSRSAGPVADPPALESGGPVGGEGGSSPGAGCSGALEPPAAGAPESLGPDGGDPESLEPPEDGSNSIPPEDEPESLDDVEPDDDEAEDEEDPESLDPADDEPESLDDPESLGAMGNGGGAAADRASELNPSRLASTQQVTAMPASNRLACKVTSGRLCFSASVGRRPRCAVVRIG
ncbi:MULTISPECIES: hypothetical protein [unclassified Mycobacterium]|uniref:hypothetical protein n=1 Tax=unclassified Mycobacterium TaxID=2642494 RepID=UPI0029C77098|nr:MULTISPECIES: hypothetical protein [unclassified Mycobacterium]